ncbi:GNAT family N-acetyltransferase [Desulfurivibrio dismutans]|uniref:GNAT family N-acetyltransferase n=1 Tax=Desulfurivibrio dismutans TaxID=1398908 RepID=UPI0023D99703|nr:GNAT family N-acetyltransferase [Desulfurivibrio alkaliphilus]MDF1614136.1 GNAT family N-acetyltransferase [Desulfurivibrio alkaliphilus]
MLQEGVELRREVYRQDVEKMAEWMADEDITEYLNEDQNIDHELKNLLSRTQLPIYSPHFNRNGSFFLVTLPSEGPIGFVRLVPKREQAEIVVVIGERRHWSQGYGRQAIRQAARHAFFEWRKEQVVATIHRENRRSKKVFEKAGFAAAEKLATETRYTMPLEHYLRH